MLHLTRKIASADCTNADDIHSLTLNFDQRSKSRLRARLDDQTEVAIVLDRGMQLLPGDLLEAASGEIVRVRAANEPVSVVHSDDPLLLARACYHLGNRHVALQISATELRYLHDHVLDEMLALLGLQVTFKQTRFEPESGAYGAHAHIHGQHHH